MASAKVFHKRAPVINGGTVNACLGAYEVGGGEMVILDDVIGEDERMFDAGPSGTDVERARPGAIAFVVEIASRKGLSLAPGDVSPRDPEVDP